MEQKLNKFKVGNNEYSFWFYRITWSSDYNIQIYINRTNNGPIKEERINHTIYFGVKNGEIDWNSFDHAFSYSMEPEFVKYVEKYMRNLAFT